MTIAQKAFKQASWLAVFKFLTQAFSWVSTIIVARLLVPDDYGLMDMATVLTGYAMLFSELGLGAAIIQRHDTTREQLSSVFWFTFIVGILFGGTCFILAYLTADIFNEPRVIPLTQAVSVIFFLNSLMIVPLNLMKKKLDFKKVGAIEMISGLTSCAAMLPIAYCGGGAWTLILGYIIRSSVQLTLVLFVQKWKPLFFFNFQDVKGYLNFGIIVAVARTFRYLFEKADRFFAGMAWSAGTLGLYGFAMILAQIPTDKVVSLIVQVSFPAFSKLQNDKAEFNAFYLNVNKVIAMIVLPLFAGGFLVAEELIKVLLDDKWIPIIFLFKMLCLAQIFLAMSAINNHVHNAQGRPGWTMCYNAASALSMSIGFYFAVKHGLHAMLIPWLTIFPVLCIAFIVVTLKKLEVGILIYLKKLSLPVLATFAMSVFVVLCAKMILFFPDVCSKLWLMLGIKMLAGALSYLSFLLIFDRSFLQKSYNMLRK